MILWWTKQYCYSEIDTAHQKLSEKCTSLIDRKGVPLFYDIVRPYVASETENK